MTATGPGSIMDARKPLMSLNPCRSISYAPDRPAQSSSSQPEWTICRSGSVFPVPDNATLERWTRQGRVRSDDYLVNHPLDVCVQARDVAELDAILRKAKAHVLGRIGCALAWVALAFAWPAPLFGSLVLTSAIGAAGLRIWTLRHRQSYQLSTSAADPRSGPAGNHARLLTIRAV